MILLYDFTANIALQSWAVGFLHMNLFPLPHVKQRDWLCLSYIRFKFVA